MPRNFLWSYIWQLQKWIILLFSDLLQLWLKFLRYQNMFIMFKSSNFFSRLEFFFNGLYLMLFLDYGFRNKWSEINCVEYNWWSSIPESRLSKPCIYCWNLKPVCRKSLISSRSPCERRSLIKMIFMNKSEPMMLHKEDMYCVHSTKSQMWSEDYVCIYCKSGQHVVFSESVRIYYRGRKINGRKLFL